MDGGDVVFLGVGGGFDLVSCGNSCDDNFRVGLSGLDDGRRPDGRVSRGWFCKDIGWGPTLSSRRQRAPSGAHRCALVEAWVDK